MNAKKVLSAAVGAVMSLTLLTANVSADYGLDRIGQILYGTSLRTIMFSLTN